MVSPLMVDLLLAKSMTLSTNLGHSTDGSSFDSFKCRDKSLQSGELGHALCLLQCQGSDGLHDLVIVMVVLCDTRGSALSFRLIR